MSTFTIQLHGVRLFGKHGVYPEEQVLGNEFEIDAAISVAAPEQAAAAADQLVNYVSVYEILKAVFDKPTLLLETLVMLMAEALKRKYPAIQKISIQIKKLHPPIANFTGAVGVRFEKEYGEN